MADTTGLLDDEMIDPVTGEIIDQKDFTERLLAQAREQGVTLVDSGGLLNQFAKNVLETALNAELTEHLDHEYCAATLGKNMRNGKRVTDRAHRDRARRDRGPKDRDGSFEPAIVPKRKRRLDWVDQIVLSLTARGVWRPVRSPHTSMRYIWGEDFEGHDQPDHGDSHR